jgi:hypothetical protein
VPVHAPFTPRDASPAVAAPQVRQIAGDIYEYDWIVPTGAGHYHSIGVHRVVQVVNGKPIGSHNAVLLAHGDAGNFNSDFMAGTHSPQSLPVYLARNGIDVWGIDYGWALVPASETDFTFMQNWGVQRDIDDLEAELVFARVVRSTSGSDGGRLALLGFSNSVWTGYSLLNEETQVSCPLRQVRAFIPVDETFVTNDPNLQASWCSVEALYRSFVAQGIYNDNSGVYYQLMGSLAQTDPNGVSPVSPPYSNLQAILVFAAAGWQLYGAGVGEQIYEHYVAGTFGPGGINTTPTGLHYTDATRYDNAAAASASYQPILQEAEAAAIVCGDANPNFSTHLRQIQVPVFHVGAAGGETYPALYTLTQLGSKDVSDYMVSFYPPDQSALDYGHFDLLIADNAQEVVWSRILSWLNNHQQDNSCSE